MGKKISLFGLGSGGVNVVKSPLHLDDNEFTKAQNAVPDRASGQGSIRKRDGLVAHNSSALDGKVWGICPVPLPAPNDRLMLFSNGFDGTSFFPLVIESTDVAATWASSAVTPQNGNRFQDGHRDRNASSYFIYPALTMGKFAYVPGQANSVTNVAGRFFAIDKDKRLYEAANFPSSAFIEAVFRAGSYLYVSVRGNGVSNRLYQYNPATNALTIIAPNTTLTAGTENIFCGCEYSGELWIGTSHATQGRVLRGRTDDTSWTEDLAGTNQHHTITSMASFQGHLYITTGALAGTAALIRRRTPGGTWSTVVTGTHSTQANYFDGLFVHNNELYAFYITRGATDICQARKFDGTSWTTDNDLSANFSASYVNQVRAVNGNLFVVVWDEGITLSKILKRTSAGVWSSTRTETVLTGTVNTLLVI